ncbi:MAG: acetoin:2,6-dichlorophenolindophenol oxidoreductase subunit alpha [Gaiellaceae bacterium]|jgi:TPP-dependent pyruvate/acetoin dehydrogenase alpha subunit|nr:acetoin:2,6-dichlorophenolindophenol oxidoreductase subunit alpha [Gaiellaceae bacterium]
MDASALLGLYTTMARIRCFEEHVGRLFRDGSIHGFVHVSIGQEAVAAGACAALRPEDAITTTHRGHGHCIAKGADATGMLAELFGRRTGLCGGKGGSMHLADPRLGILGANGIVGAGIPIAAGAALSARVLGDERVAVAFFGEGAVHTGAFHEGLTLAVAWRLPVIFICENNGYAEFTRSDRWGGPKPVERAAVYGLGADAVDGNDAVLVHAVVAAAVDAARSGGGPRFIEARTTRVSGHYEGDAQPYRSQGELDDVRQRDPLRVLRRRLPDAAAADEIDAAVDREIERAVATALEAPYPEPDDVLEDVYA